MKMKQWSQITIVLEMKVKQWMNCKINSINFISYRIFYKLIFVNVKDISGIMDMQVVCV